MNIPRRSFMKSLLTGCVAPAFLPGAGRLWKITSAGILVQDSDITSLDYFRELLLKESRFFSEELRKTIRPLDVTASYISKGTW